MRPIAEQLHVLRTGASNLEAASYESPSRADHICKVENMDLRQRKERSAAGVVLCSVSVLLRFMNLESRGKKKQKKRRGIAKELCKRIITCIIYLNHTFACNCILVGMRCEGGNEKCEFPIVKIL